jgi:lipopolysaccharide/colanic/teichoic acid biosynthesis glycosyltransferase
MANGAFHRFSGKRAIDVVVAGAALIILSPLIAAVAVVVALALGPPLLFRQVRPGLHGQPFTLIKFRTMSNARGPDGSLLPDEQRLGRVGAFLRSTSFDELPELWNVLKGDMSIVGPRPLLMQYLSRYNAHQARRHEVPPGITGWAVVNGRNALSWEEKLDLDVWYVDHRSLVLDARIIWRTLTAVVRRQGISSDGHVTTPEFMGTEHRRPDGTSNERSPIDGDKGIG